MRISKIILLAWLWAALTSGKIVATLVGSAGLFIALTRIFMIKRLSAKADDKRIPVKVKTESSS
jgi:hypothetical protein